MPEKNPKELKDIVKGETAGERTVDWTLFIAKIKSSAPGTEEIKKVLVNQGILLKASECANRKVFMVLTRASLCAQCLSLDGEQLLFPNSEEEAQRFAVALKESLAAEETENVIWISKAFLISYYPYQERHYSQTRLPV